MTSRTSESFQVLEGHIVLERDYGLAVLDTGTPISLPAPDIASRQLGRPIARLIGCEELAGQVLEVDWAVQRLTWAPSHSAPDGAIPLHMSALGVPLIDIWGPAGSVQAVFDTGAPLAYVPGDLVSKQKSTGSREDFFPGLGQFKTSVYRVALTIGTLDYDLECGVLPPLLQMALGMLCPSGFIVGSQVMRDHITRFDVDAGWIQFERCVR